MAGSKADTLFNMTFPARRARLSQLAATCSLLLVTALSAQTPAKPALTPAPDTANPTQTFTRAAQPGGVAISPDGTTVAWTLRGREGAALHLTDVANPSIDKLIKIEGASHCSVGDPTWSPDGATLAFLSNCTGDKSKPDQEQIFLWSKATGNTRQLTHVTGDLAQPAWSPDGKSIAFLFVENATRHAGALDAMPPWNGVIGEDGVEIQRVYSVNVADAAGHWLTPDRLHVYEFSWAPDSKDIAFIAANPPGENTWWIAKLYAEPVSGGEPRVILDPVTVPGPLHGLQIAVPRWSPNGKRLCFIGGLMSDQGSTGGDVWVIDADGTHLFDATPNIDGTPTFAVWTRNNTLGFIEDRRGHSLIVDWDADKHSVLPNGDFDLGEVSLSGGPIKNAVSFATANGGTLAFVKSGFYAAPEVFTLGDSNALRQLTHLNASIKPSPIKFESIEWENDGFHVQGWLTYPKNYDPAKKYPLIVEVHGGPSASAGPRGGTQWADLGYFDFQPNPRGSFGQGEKFVQANIKDFGYGDLRDILTGIDAIEKKVSVDDHRVGLTGWSYGGFMSMFAETQTNRFRTIIAGAGISDWKSYYGENSIDQWMIPFFGASVYDDPAVYAKSSAIEYIKNAKTPMLIIVGDRDGECPAPQSFEMWHALRAEGVKTQLVVYPNEGHGFTNPAHIRDRMEREVRWFAENMPASK
jgi:dipeptidyl aminopeptidase/acylaminoacyl peptidase